MADTGWLNFGTFADDASFGTDAWASPGNAAASDNLYASCHISVANNWSHYLVASNISGLAIPQGSLITKIEFKFERKGNSSNGTTTYWQCMKSGVLVGDYFYENVVWPATDTNLILDHAYLTNDRRWGLPTDPAYFDANFGISMRCTVPDNVSTFYIDQIQARFTYESGMFLGL